MPGGGEPSSPMPGGGGQAGFGAGEPSPPMPGGGAALPGIIVVFGSLIIGGGISGGGDTLGSGEPSSPMPGGSH